MKILGRWNVNKCSNTDSEMRWRGALSLGLRHWEGEKEKNNPQPKLNFCVSTICPQFWLTFDEKASDFLLRWKIFQLGNISRPIISLCWLGRWGRGEEGEDVSCICHLFTMICFVSFLFFVIIKFEWTDSEWVASWLRLQGAVHHCVSGFSKKVGQLGECQSHPITSLARVALCKWRKMQISPLK